MNRHHLQATYAFHEGDVYKAYELYVEGGVHRMAHELSVSYLAPEAVLCNDILLLRNLFFVLDKNIIPDWSFGGQVGFYFSFTLPMFNPTCSSISIMLRLCQDFRRLCTDKMNAKLQM